MKTVDTAKDVLDALLDSNVGEFWINETDEAFLISPSIEQGVRFVFTQMPPLIIAAQAFSVLAKVAKERGTDDNLCQRWVEYNLFRYGKKLGYTPAVVKTYMDYVVDNLDVA